MKILNTIGAHFRIHWKLIICISLIWFILMTIAFVIPLATEGFSISYGSLNETQEVVEEHQTWSASRIMIPISMLYTMLFKNFGFIIYGIFIIIIINKIILKEVHSTQISLWLTQPLSKTQTIIAKFIVLFIVLSITYLPSFTIMMIVSSFAKDADKLLINLFLGGFQTYIFLIMLSLVFFIISLLLIEKTTIFNVLTSLILTYFGIIGMIEFVVLLLQIDNEALNIVIKYVGLQVFVTQIFDYDLSAAPIIYKFNETFENGAITWFTIEANVVKDINMISYSLFTIFMIAISFGLLYLSTKIFKNKSFNI